MNEDHLKLFSVLHYIPATFLMISWIFLLVGAGMTSSKVSKGKGKLE